MVEAETTRNVSDRLAADAQKHTEWKCKLDGRLKIVERIVHTKQKNCRL